MRRPLALLMAIALTLGCQGQPGPTSVKPKAAKPKATPSVGAIATTGRAPIPLSEPQRVVDTGTQAVELIGKVKIISDNGASIISDNGASVISNNGGAIISDNGASLVTEGKRGTSIGKTQYTLQQAGGSSALPETLLADAQIEVLDAAGNVLVTPDQKPITAMTDKQGNYSLKTALPNENLILRVRLFQGGQLFAFTTKDKRTSTLDIDTASSLGAAYVMHKYVKQQQTVLNLLPGAEAEKLQAEMESARALLATRVPTYQPQELVSLTEQLRGQAPQLDETIKRIEALLVAGQKDLGNGLLATQVALAAPAAVAADALGNVYVVEASAGRIRKIAKDGTSTVYVGPGAPPPRDSILGSVRQIAIGPDGSLYAIKRLAKQIIKIPTEGPPVVVAGNGTNAQGAVGGRAADTPIYKPEKLCMGADGKLYFSESSTLKEKPARLLYIDAGGLLQQVPMPEARWNLGEIYDFTVAKDGTIWLFGIDPAGDLPGKLDDKNFLARLKPGGSWEFLAEGLPNDEDLDAAIGPDGALYVSRFNLSKIFRYDDAGQPTVFAGTDQAGFGGDGGPATAARLNGPRGLHFGPDGTLYVAEEGNGLVRAIGKDGQIRTIAGTTGLTQVGDALTVSINQPGGLALDPQGRIVVAEAASHTIKRLDGSALTVVAGTTAGFAGDGGPATAAAMFRPNGIAYHDGELYVLDNKNNRLRKIDKNGVITTLAGGQDGNPKKDSTPAAEARFESPVTLAISPEGIPYWTDNNSHVIMRLKDGFVERVAGQLGGVKGKDGDGGPALQAKLNGPAGLTFDKAGNLYVADFGNLRVRKIDKAGIITTVAGLDQSGVAALIFAGKANTQNNEPATQSALWGPFALVADDQGNLYISESGTSALAAFGDAVDTNQLGYDPSLIPAELAPNTPARIRKLTPDGKLVNVTGPGTSLLDDTGGDDMLVLPVNLIFDAQGRLVIADSGLNQLKVLPKGSF